MNLLEVRLVGLCLFGSTISSKYFRGYAKQSEPKKTDRETSLPVRRVDGIVQE